MAKENERKDRIDEREELERRVQDGSGRDPTARRGAAEEGVTISDADVGEDQIKAKREGDKPLMDKGYQGKGED